VEKATNELLTLLLTVDGEELMMETESVVTMNTIRSSMSRRASVPHIELNLPPGEAAEARKRKKRNELQEEASALMEYFRYKNIDALVHSTRNTLEKLRRGVSPPSLAHYSDLNDHTPDRVAILKLQLELAIPQLILKPNLEEVQSLVTQVVHVIVDVNKRVYQWGQSRVEAAKSEPSSATRSHVMAEASQVMTVQLPVKKIELKNFHRTVSEHKDIAKLVASMNSIVSIGRNLIIESYKHFNTYEHLWTLEQATETEKFMEQDPLLGDFEAKIKYYEELELIIMEESDRIIIGPFQLDTPNLKVSIAAECKSWKVIYAHKMNNKFNTLMEKTLEMIEDISKRLSRPIKDLDDIRTAMVSLKEIRENEIQIDLSMNPIEESYTLLNKFQIQVNKEEAERVDTLRFSWQKLLTVAVRSHCTRDKIIFIVQAKVQDHLIKVQTEFQVKLSTNVEKFVHDTDAYYKEYAESGPMAEGISPREASDRLNLFQTQFDELWRKFQIYSSGEELFGLSVSDYPELNRIRKELNLLQKLYQLYNTVMDSIDGYYDILWAEVLNLLILLTTPVVDKDTVVL
jgi:dynein heavy chain